MTQETSERFGMGLDHHSTIPKPLYDPRYKQTDVNSEEQGAFFSCPPEWSHAGLMLIAHGSHKMPQARRPLDQLTREIAKQHWFATTQISFWKQPPFIEDSLRHLQEQGLRHAYVLPLFSGDGVFTAEILPKTLGAPEDFLGQESGFPHIWTRRDGMEIRYLAPLGKHPKLPELLLSRAQNIIEKASLDPHDTAILLIGHGSQRSRRSSQSAERMAHNIASLAMETPDAPTEIKLAFLEEAPYVSDWPQNTIASNILVFPLLIVEGQHGGKQIPRLFGMGNLLSEQPLEQPDHGHRSLVVGPISHKGRRIWYQRGIAYQREIMGLLLQQLKEASS